MADSTSNAPAENKSYYERHREKCLAAAKKYQADHKQIYAAYHQEYYKANKEKIKARNKAYILKRGYTRPPKPPRAPKSVPLPAVPKTPTLPILETIRKQEYEPPSRIVIQTPPEPGQEFVVSFK